MKRIILLGADSQAHGPWQSVVDGIALIFDFSIDRLRATPKVCRL